MIYLNKAMEFSGPSPCYVWLPTTTIVTAARQSRLRAINRTHEELHDVKSRHSPLHAEVMPVAELGQDTRVSFVMWYIVWCWPSVMWLWHDDQVTEPLQLCRL